MADNLVLNAGSGGATAKADQLADSTYVFFSKILDATPDSVNAWIIDSSGRGKTISDAGTGPWPVTDNGGSLTVDGTVAISGTTTTAESQVITDNAAFTDGTSKVFAAGYIFDEVAGTALTENDAAAARIDSKRAQVLVIEDATTRGQRATVSAGGAVKTDGSAVTQPVSGTVTTTPPANASTNIAQIAGTATDVNSGAKSAGTQRVVLATDQPQLTNKLLVTPDANSAINNAQVAGTAVDVNSGNKSAGTQRVVLATDQPALTTPMPTQQSPGTTGGYSVSRLLSAATTNATSVKASAGQVYGWMLFNTSASTKFLKLYNKASAPTVGTDTPFMTIPIPAGGGEIADFDGGIAMGTGIAFAITGAVTDADATAVALNDVIVNLLYK